MTRTLWIFIALFVQCLTSLSILANPIGFGNETVLSYPKTWIADLFYETLKDFMVSGNVGNSACRRQTNMYRRHLENGSHWAIQSEFKNIFSKSMKLSFISLIKYCRACKQVYIYHRQRFDCFFFFGGGSIVLSKLTSRDFAPVQYNN